MSYNEYRGYKLYLHCKSKHAIRRQNSGCRDNQNILHLRKLILFYLCSSILNAITEQNCYLANIEREKRSEKFIAKMPENCTYIWLIAFDHRLFSSKNSKFCKENEVKINYKLYVNKK